MSTTVVFSSTLLVALATAQTAVETAHKQEKVPQITAGPDLEADARAVDARIAEVTVFSDRARIRRKAEAALPPGITAIRLPDLPGAALLETLRVSVQNAKLLRVEAAPIERERISIAAVETALGDLERKSDRRMAIDGELRVHQQELSFLGELVAKPPVEEEHRVGKPLPPIVFDAWRAILDVFAERRRTVLARVRQLEMEQREVDEAIAELRRNVALRDLGAFTSRNIRVLAIVDARSAVSSKIGVEYFIPGARWMPAYDLHYFAKDGAVEISTYGLVSQATGEPWNDVDIALSTAIPGQGIELPELLTWTLGEKSELVPRPMPATALAAAQPFAPPRPSVTEKERLRAETINSLRGRLANLDTLAANYYRTFERGEGQKYPEGGMPQPSVPMTQPAPQAPPEKLGEESVVYDKKTTHDFSDDSIDGDLTKPEGEYLESRKRISMAPPSARVMGKSVRTMDEAGGSYGTAVAAEADRDDAYDYASTPLALFEQTMRPTLTDPNLPAVMAGGLDYVYPGAARFTIPASADKLRVPLAVDRHPVSVYYEATPSLSPNAFLKAAVENKSGRPLLRGSVNIFVGDEFAGEGMLQTTGPGGKIELPLGADQDIRIQRKVMPSTRTEGVFSKDDITTYTTEIEVGNYKRLPIRIFVIDQIPKSGNQDVEVELQSASPQPKDPPNADGLMRFELAIPAGQTKKIVFAYSVGRPSGWMLQQY